MRVRAKVAGEIQHPLPEGGFWGVRFQAGEKLIIPDAYFNEAIFAEVKSEQDVPAQKKTKDAKKVKKGGRRN